MSIELGQRLIQLADRVGTFPIEGQIDASEVHSILAEATAVLWEMVRLRAEAIAVANTLAASCQKLNEKNRQLVRQNARLISAARWGRHNIRPGSA